MFDAYWSVIPPLLLAYWWWQGPIGASGPGALRCWLMAAVVGYWAVRLTANWEARPSGELKARWW